MHKRYAIVKWHMDATYSTEEIVKEYQSQTVADRAAYRMNHADPTGNYVVRTIIWMKGSNS